VGICRGARALRCPHSRHVRALRGGVCSARVERDGGTCISGLEGQPSLEAVWVGQGERVAVIAPPHPLMGGELGNPVVQRLADALGAAGMRSLLFNWRGVGESGGVPSADPADADRDYEAALAAAAADGPLALAAGYSFGGATAIRIAARRPLLGVLAVAPPPALFSEGDLGHLGGRVALIAAELDNIAPSAELEALADRCGASIVTVAQADHFFSGELSTLRRHVLALVGP
jgi:uncharacterized protein